MKKQEIVLHFNNNRSFNQKGKHVRDNLSGALRTGNSLWVCCDERSSLERLSILPDGTCGKHKTFDLNEYLTLPAGTDCEVDIEGLGVDGNKYLWLVGSHSLARKKPRKTDSPEKQIKRLAKIKDDPNRYLLARIPMILNKETGDYDLIKTCPDPDNTAEIISAGQLVSEGDVNQLMKVLADDEHFKHFMKIPGKDNGFDIEGLAVNKNKIFIGIRGPVLRGWASILELQIEDITKTHFQLKPDSNGKLYKKHFLHLDGMGIRDLRVKENDLLILAGPTMDLDGTIAVYRWPDGINQREESIVHRSELTRLFDVPHSSGHDKAEGIALFDKERVLVVFDSPTDARKPNENSVIADLYELS